MREIIQSFWDDFKEQVGFKIVDASIEPNISLGITNEGCKALLIDIPEELFKRDFKLNTFENIDLELNSDFKGVVLVLKDESFFEIYIDFILIILEKISHIKDPKVYLTETIKLYNLWGVFFERKKNRRINFKKLLGVIGELFFIFYYLENDSVNENIIESWEGPNMKSHDFIFSRFDIEVKAKMEDSSIINISSLYQLETEKPLYLSIVTVSELDEGEENVSMNIVGLIESISKLLINKGHTTTVFIFKLLQLGINIYDSEAKEKYQKIKFKVKSIEFYDVVENEFPRLLTENIPIGIKNIKYAIKLDTIEKFKTSNKFLENGTN